MSATKVPRAVRISVSFANRLYLLSASGANWVIDQRATPTVNVNYSSGLYIPPLLGTGTRVSAHPTHVHGSSSGHARCPLQSSAALGPVGIRSVGA